MELYTPIPVIDTPNLARMRRKGPLVQAGELLREHRWAFVFGLLAVGACLGLAAAGMGSGVGSHAVHPISEDQLRSWVLKSSECEGGGVPQRAELNATCAGPDCWVLRCKTPPLRWDSYLTIAVTIVALLAMGSNAPADVSLLSATVTLRLFGVLDDEDAWQGFSSQGVLSVGVLFVVAAALERVGTVDRCMRALLGSPTRTAVAMARLLLPVAAISAFMNNTPVVAMLIPIVEAWAQRMRKSPAIFLMPLSFASMLGGMCTLIGTSTNLILQSLVRKKGLPLITMFEVVPVGVPTLLVGITYMSLTANVVLGKGTAVATSAESTKRWLQNSPLAGTGLLALPNTTVVGHRRGQRWVAHPPGTVELHPGDLVRVACTARAVACVRRVPGLALRDDAAPLLLGAKRRHRRLVEAVIGWDSELVGRALPLDGARIARRFGATPVAVMGVPRRDKAKAGGATDESEPPAAAGGHVAAAAAGGRSATYGALERASLDQPLLSGFPRPASAASASSSPSSSSSFATPATAAQRAPTGSHELSAASPPPSYRRSGVELKGRRGSAGEDDEGQVEGGDDRDEVPPRAIASPRGSVDYLVLEVSRSSVRMMGRGAGRDDGAPGGRADEEDEDEEPAEGGGSLLHADRLAVRAEQKASPEARATAEGRADDLEEGAAGAPLGKRPGDSVRRCFQREASRHLQAGDVLLLEAHPDLLRSQAWHDAFLTAKEVPDSAPPREGTAMDTFRMVASAAALVVMVALSAAGTVPLLVCAILASGLLVATKCITLKEAFASIKGRVLLAIVSAFGLGTALEKTGVAQFLAHQLVALVRPLGPYGILAAVSLVTSSMSCVVSNNATVILMFPICYKTYLEVGTMHLREFLMILMVSASSSFLTPIGYQTNMMVLAPGGYKFSDFVRMGGPMLLILCAFDLRLAGLVDGMDVEESKSTPFPAVSCAAPSYFALQRDAGTDYDPRMLQSRVDAMLAGVDSLGPPAWSLHAAVPPESVPGRAYPPRRVVLNSAGESAVLQARSATLAGVATQYTHYSLDGVDVTAADETHSALEFIHSLKARRSGPQPGDQVVERAFLGRVMPEVAVGERRRRGADGGAAMATEAISSAGAAAGARIGGTGGAAAPWRHSARSGTAPAASVGAPSRGVRPAHLAEEPAADDVATAAVADALASIPGGGADEEGGSGFEGAATAEAGNAPVKFARRRRRPHDRDHHYRRGPTAASSH